MAMRAVLMVLLCACSTTTVAPRRSEDAPPGSHVERIRGRPAPAAIAALDDEVRRLKSLAGRADDPGPLLLRLADSLMERAAAHGREEARAFEAGVEHPVRSPAREAAEARASRHGEERVADLTRARGVLEAIDAESPEGERARRTLFWLLAERREWAADATAAARAVVATRSTGSLLAAAHLRLAEAAFLDARLEEALVHYEAVLGTEGADGQTAAFASYKRAWVLLNLQRFEEADRAFGRTLVLARGLEQHSLAREAAKDRLRVHVALRTPASDVLAIIEESTDEPALRATLVERYEQMLRDAGQLELAEAFRRLVLR